MVARTQTRSAPQWPFWLLLAAWVCANSPQAATYALFAWIAEARSFSHQQRLSSDVVALLGGEAAAPAEASRAAAAAPSPVEPLPAVPPDAVLKKFPLACEPVAEFLPPVLRADRPADDPRGIPGTLRAPPPHGPPRVAAV